VIDNIIGARVRLVTRGNPEVAKGRGVVRALSCDGGNFTLLVEVTGAQEWFGVSDGGLVQLSLLDESIEAIVDPPSETAA
jgi:hypothetical protein